MSKSRIFVLSTALLAACAEAPLPGEEASLQEGSLQEAQATDTVSSPFVGRSGSAFVVNGQPFRFVGANMKELLYQPWDQIERELDYAQTTGMSVIRLLLTNDCWDDPREIRDKLRRIVDSAYARRIRVTVVFTSAYRNQVYGWERCKRPGQPPTFTETAFDSVRGDAGFYTRTWDVFSILNDAWIDWGYNQNYWGFMRDTVSSFRDHPGIFSWNIAGEVGIGDPGNAQMLLNFYSRVASEMKALDPNHLVGAGIISATWAFAHASNAAFFRDRLYMDTAIDYVGVHMYEKAGQPEGNDDQQRDDIFAANVWYQKPVVIEEFGGNTFEWVNSRYQQYFNGDPSYQVDGIMNWAVTAWTPADVDSWGTDTTRYCPISSDQHVSSTNSIQAERHYRGLWGRTSGLDPSMPLVVDNNPDFNDPSRAAVQFDPSQWVAGAPSNGARWGGDLRRGYANGTTTREDGFEFRFKLDSDACKIVETWFSGSTTRSPVVPYVVYNALGQHLGTSYVNQQLNPQTWVPLGGYCFKAGWNRVVISHWTPVAGDLSADAIRVADNRLSEGRVQPLTPSGLVQGWAVDPDTSAQSSSIHFYIDGLFAGSAPANLPRPDVNANTPYKRGDHGFSWPIPAVHRDNRQHTIAAYALDTSGLPQNPRLNGPLSTFTLAP